MRGSVYLQGLRLLFSVLAMVVGLVFFTQSSAVAIIGLVPPPFYLGLPWVFLALALLAVRGVTKGEYRLFSFLLAALLLPGILLESQHSWVVSFAGSVQGYSRLSFNQHVATMGLVVILIYLVFIVSRVSEVQSELARKGATERERSEVLARMLVASVGLSGTALVLTIGAAMLMSILVPRVQRYIAEHNLPIVAPAAIGFLLLALLFFFVNDVTDKAS